MAKKPTTEGEAPATTAPDGGLVTIPAQTQPAADGTADGLGATDPALAQTQPAAEVIAEGDVIVEVIDTLNHNSEAFGAGDTVVMPIADAIKLRALGVVSFDDPTA